VGVLQPWTGVVALHAIAASLAMVLGPVQLIRPKGDLPHRVIGRVWAALMLGVAASSFLFGGWDAPLHIFLRVLATWTLISVALGIVMAKRGKINRHLAAVVIIAVAGAFVGGTLGATRTSRRAASPA
jgi:uncharacterized membrane protein